MVGYRHARRALEDLRMFGHRVLDFLSSLVALADARDRIHACRESCAHSSMDSIYSEHSLSGGVMWMTHDESRLRISLKNSDQFLALFHLPLLDRHKVAPKVDLSLFVLKIDGGEFDYDNLYKQLGNASYAYVLSRVKFAGLEQGNVHELTKAVQGSFRAVRINDGEGGELLLYCFLESHLGAPKLLSKMELKTDKNDYVKGADGLHLLQVQPGEFHLIYGESKMIADSTERGSSFRKAVADAISSVKKLRTTGLSNEVNLVDSNLMKEAFSGAELEFLKSILVPTRNGPAKESAFGLLLGFEIDTGDWPLIEMTARQFSERVHAEVQAMVEARFEYIKDQLVNAGLEGFHFYIWAIPFIKNEATNIDSVRKSIVGYIA